jgi:hypothetical protein
MAGADHGRDPLVALRPLNRTAGERPKPPPFRKAERHSHRLALGMRIGGGALALLDPGQPQLIGEPAFAVAARRE